MQSKYSIQKLFFLSFFVFFLLFAALLLILSHIAKMEWSTFLRFLAIGCHEGGKNIFYSPVVLGKNFNKYLFISLLITNGCLTYISS